MIAITKKYANANTPLYHLPNGRLVNTWLNYGTVVYAIDGPTEYGGAPLVEVECRYGRGWVYAEDLDPYIETLPKDCVVIENQTSDRWDAEQNVIYAGRRRVNMCGELCIAYILGVSLDTVLNAWQRESPNVWERVFKGNVDTTGVPDLLSICSAFGRKARSLADATRDRNKRPRYTPDSLLELTISGMVIAGVKISANGRLAQTGVPHWVVVVDVVPERAGCGRVYIYNPYFNRDENYSWSEFTAAAKVPSGVVVERD